MEDTIVVIREILRGMKMNDEIMLVAIGDYWIAEACNPSSVVMLGETGGVFRIEGDTADDVLVGLLQNVVAFRVAWERTNDPV
jgi:hypothetical protein